MILLLKFSNLRYAQYLSAIAAMTSITAISMHFVWTSPALPQLTSPNSPIGVTLSSIQSTIVASLLFVGVAIGSTAASWPIEHLGRKKTFLVALIPAFVAWIMIIFANSVVILYIARLIAGASAGIIFSVGPMYNGEIAENDIRGQISNLLTVTSISGNLFVFAVGPFVSYTILASAAAAFPVISFILCLFIPESPFYLVKKQKVEEARAALTTLSSASANKEFIEKRLGSIQDSVEKDMLNKSSMGELFKAQYGRPVLIATGLRTLMYGSGMYCIFSYMQTIMQKSGSTLIPPNYSSLTFGVVQLLSGIASGQVVDKIGRKPIIIVSCAFSGLSLIAEGIYFYLQEATHYDVSSISWLPLTALLVYEIFAVIGILSLPFIIVGEIFPLNVKGVALSLNTFYGAPLGVLSVMTFQPICDYWGIYVAFWIYAAFCIAGLLFSVLFVPETKGKSFIEIQKKMNR